MPIGGSVVITKYSNGELISQPSFFDEVMDQPVDCVRLHPEDKTAVRGLDTLRQTRAADPCLDTAA